MIAAWAEHHRETKPSAIACMVMSCSGDTGASLPPSAASATEGQRCDIADSRQIAMKRGQPLLAGVWRAMSNVSSQAAIASTPAAKRPMAEVFVHRREHGAGEDQRR